MTTLLRLSFLLTLFVASQFASARATVHVAQTSVQPPFVFSDASHSGLVRDIVTEMNRTQDKYNFVLGLYPPSRIVKDHENLHIDLVAFNDLKWGWASQGSKGSLSLTEGRDVFFTLQKNLNHEDKANHTIAAVRGFHYGFANFSTSELEANPRVYLLEDEPHIVDFLSYGRAHKGITSEAYLNWIALSKPELYKSITILEEDHRSTRRFVVLPNSVISVDEVNKLLLTLNKSGLLALIFSRYGQPPPPLK